MLAERYTPNQRQAIEAASRDICVSAGAGSGKTGVLIGRFLQSVAASGTVWPFAPARAGVDNMLVITFTEKATREVKSRLADRMSGSGLISERRQLETAYVSTIHGFCSRLLQENPFEAGIDPQFSVLEEARARRLLREAFEQVVEEDTLTQNQDTAELVASAQAARQFGALAGDTLDGLAAAVEAVLSSLRGAGKTLAEVEAHGQSDLRHISVYRDSPVWAVLDPCLREIEACTLALRGGAGAARGVADFLYNTVLEKADQLGTPGATLEGALTTLEEAHQAVKRVPMHSARTSPAEMERTHALERIKAACQSVSDLYGAAVEQERNALKNSKHLWSLAARVWRAYDRKKRALGVLDNDDLQAEAVRLLERSPEVRRRYQSLFRHILVDEFQDTNPLQMRLIELLHNGKREDGGVPDNPDNGLFVVGDVQQSIYGFRHAEPTLFRNLERQFREGGKGLHIPLSVNFRSRPEILALVEVVFRQVWRDSPTPFVPLTPGADFAPKPGPSLEVLLTQGVARRDYTRLEAEALAARVQKLVEGQEVRITGRRDQDQGRPAAYRDVAILFRSLTDVQKYEEAFARRGVPFYVVGGGRGYYARHEIRDLLNVLTVIEQPTDDVALAAALRSPFVGLDAETLLRVTRRVAETPDRPGDGGEAQRARGRGPLYDVIKELLAAGSLPTHEERKLNTFVTVIEALRAQEDRLPVGHLLERLLSRTHYDARMLCRLGGRRRLANIRKLLQMANAEPVNGVHAFTRRLRDLERLSEREGDAPLEEEAADVVRFLTIHAAKGLEFPVVVLADLSRPLIFPERALFLCDPRRMALGTRIGGEPDLTYRAIERLRQEADREEYERLLYVAMTRAQEHLLLCGNIGGRRTGFNWGDNLFRLLGLLEAPPEPVVQTLAGGLEAVIAPLAHYAHAQEAGASLSPRHEAQAQANRVADAILNGDALS